MDFKTQQLLNDVDRAIVQYRGVYSAWSKQHGISYNEMLVLYTIRDNGFCTQKQICGNYLLPKQTVHHVIASMMSNGLLREEPMKRAGREKALVFTEKGEEYAAPLLASIGELEEKAVSAMGLQRLRQMTSLVREYNEALTSALHESR